MKKIRILLALLVLSCGASSFAQYDNGDAVGGICREGDYNCIPQIPDHGGGAPVDPSPYDPQPGYGDHNPYQPGRPERPDRPNNGYGDVREVYLGQYFRDQSLDLMRLLNLNSARRQRIDSVEVTVRSGDNYTSLSLVADGYVEDSQSAWGNWVTLHPRRDLIIGQNLRRLHLDVRGKIWIDRITVRLSGGGYQPNPPPYPPGGGSEFVLPAQIDKNFYQNGMVDLMQATGLRQYHGYRVTHVTVYARAMTFQARTRVLANGMHQGQLTFGNGISGQTVRMSHQFVVGQNLNALTLLVDDPAHIDRVEVRLSRY